MNNTLHILGLSGNRISDRGAKSIGDALKYNSGLETLELSYNMLKCSSAKHIANGLKHNIGLRVWDTNKTLVVDNNQISDIGAKAFMETLECIDLQRNHISSETERQL